MIIDKTEPFIINIFDDYEKLYIKDIYNMYETEPIIFTCVSEKYLYICLCYEFRGISKYILNRVTEEEINKLLNKEITIYDIFAINHMFRKTKILASRPYEDVFGIQSDFLDSKYIAVRNENLKALLEKFNIDSDELDNIGLEDYKAEQWDIVEQYL